MRKRLDRHRTGVPSIFEAGGRLAVSGGLISLISLVRFQGVATILLERQKKMLDPETDSLSTKCYMSAYIGRKEDPWNEIETKVDFHSTDDFEWTLKYISHLGFKPDFRDISRCLILPNGNVVLEIKLPDKMDR